MQCSQDSSLIFSVSHFSKFENRLYEIEFRNELLGIINQKQLYEVYDSAEGCFLFRSECANWISMASHCHKSTLKE